MSKSPAALRRSVEDRIRKLVCLAQGRTHDRIRTILVMERFMVRIMAVFPEGTLLKGGLALELRLSQARTTKDIDLRAVGNTENLEILLEKSQRIAQNRKIIWHLLSRHTRNILRLRGRRFGMMVFVIRWIVSWQKNDTPHLGWIFPMAIPYLAPQLRWKAQTFGVLMA